MGDPPVGDWPLGLPVSVPVPGPLGELGLLGLLGEPGVVAPGEGELGGVVVLGGAFGSVGDD
ncbi:MAG TPA: hypothetical protein VKB80_30520 [Kofleriaceae bacterium]|nr:hypothetical protein [Kofleriaceae bacterium]